MLTESTIEVAIEALEFRRSALIVELPNWREGHSMKEKYLNEIASVQAAIADLQAAQQPQVTPGETDA